MGAAYGHRRHWCYPPRGNMSRNPSMSDFRMHPTATAMLGLLLFTAAAGPAAVASQATGSNEGPSAFIELDEAIAVEPKAQALPLPPNRSRPSRAAIVKLIDRYSKQNGLERDLVHALVRAESGYNPHAVSPAGAVGLMQVMPQTAADYGVHSVEALFDVQTNVRVGTQHLKRLVRRYGIGKAVMAYNGGEGALERQNGFISYAETQRYTHRVLTAYLATKGVSPYSLEARDITGITLTPAMASAGGGAVKGRGKGRLLRRVDLSTLSLRVRPSLTDRALDPAMLRAGPESQPMFVLEPRGK